MNNIILNAAKVFFAEVISLLVSFVIIVFFAYISIFIVAESYNANHPIPNPVERGEDIGAGLMVVGGAIWSLAISIPAAVLVHFFVFKKIFKRSCK